MKKFFYLLVAAVAMIGFTACDDQDPVCKADLDWAPVNIYIQVADSAGNKLINPSDSTIVDGTTVTYKGQTLNVSRARYNSNVTPAGIKTRAYEPVFYGFELFNLKWLNSDYGNTYAFHLGEIDGSKDMDEDIVINWANGTSNTIHYHCSNHDNTIGTCDRWFSLDGVEQSSNFITIVR